jgi:hypothetical protein
MRRISLTLPSMAKLFGKNQKKALVEATSSINLFDDSLVDLLIEDTGVSEEIAGCIKKAKELIPESVRKENSHVAVALMGLAGHFAMYEFKPPTEVAKVELKKFTKWAVKNGPASATLRSEEDIRKFLTELSWEYWQIDIPAEELVVS